MHVIKGRRAPTNGDAEVMSRSTGRMRAQNLIELIHTSAPDEGVVDMHEIEATFADGSRRIPLTDPSDGAIVQAVPMDAADTTRRMTAVEADALVQTEIRSESTMRMSAIHQSELVALITPTDVRDAPNAHDASAAHDAFEEPVVPIVTFTTPRMVLPLPAPAEEIEAIEPEPPEVTLEPTIATKRGNGWTVFAIVTLLCAAGGLAYVQFLT